MSTPNAPAPRSPRRTAPRDVRRRQLILAAMESISERGLSGTTLRHVTENAKLSHGVVNYHFESKDALYDAILEFLAREYFELWTTCRAEAGPDPARQLAAMIRADFDPKICTQEKMAAWFAFWGQAKYRPNYLRIHHEYDLKREAAVTEICAALIADGAYEGITPEWAARTIGTLIDGQWLSLMLYPDQAGPMTSRRDCMIALARMFPRHFSLDGLMTAAPGGL